MFLKRVEGCCRCSNVSKWMRRWDETRLVRLTEWICKLTLKTRWCISKWAICYFQAGHGWRGRKSDNKSGAGTARRLKRDKVVKIARLSSCKNFVGERDEMICDAFVNLYRHWSVSLRKDPDDVPHCRILSPDKAEWPLIPATLCKWRCCFLAKQLWFMTRIGEEEVPFQRGNTCIHLLGSG